MWAGLAEKQRGRVSFSSNSFLTAFLRAGRDQDHQKRVSYHTAEEKVKKFPEKAEGAPLQS